MAQAAEGQRGKKPNQKLKPYLVLQYLMKNTDADHIATAYDIIAFLQDDCGVDAERRSVYEDIKDINRAAIALSEKCTIDDAAAMLEDDDDDELKLIRYDKSRKGFYVQDSARQFDFNDIRLIAECVYSAKFIAEGQAKRLVENVICDFVSTHQAAKIKHEALLTDRVRTNNRAVLNNLSVINEAMSTRREGEFHSPERITFKYLKHSIDDVSQQIERRQGETYEVSPYYLLINDGYYYLLGYNTAREAVRTYRVDRMKDVRLTGERINRRAFRNIDIRSFAQRAVSMYAGEEEQVVIQMNMPLLDTAIDQFGTKNVRYQKVNDETFTMTLTVDISNQFFAWLLRFGAAAKILSPEPVVERFAAYLDEVRAIYTKPADG